MTRFRVQRDIPLLVNGEASREWGIPVSRLQDLWLSRTPRDLCYVNAGGDFDSSEAVSVICTGGLIPAETLN